MRTVTRLVAATAIGILATLGVEAVSQSETKSCAGGEDMSRLNKRFDDLEQAIVALQAQSAKAASDSALANVNNQRQLANISSQVADLNTQVVGILGRIR